MQSLQNMLNRSEPAQAKRLKAMQKILQGYDDERIELLQKTPPLKNQLLTLNALFLDWTDPSNENDQLPDELRINCRYLADALFHLGRISQVTFEDAINKLGAFPKSRNTFFSCRSAFVSDPIQFIC